MEQTIIARLNRAIREKVFPGCVLGVVYKNSERLIYPVGHYTYEDNAHVVTKDTIYDLASITKSVAGTSVLLKLAEEKKIDLEDRLADYIPEFGNFENKKDVTLHNVLTYSIDLLVPSLSSLKDKAPEEIVDCVVKATMKSPPGKQFIYNNSTALFISLVVEKVTGKRLDVLCDEYFFRPLGMHHTTFHPEQFDINDIAPTEIDSWRGRVIQGEVHDESTFVLQKKYMPCIAGLFGTVSDLLVFQEMLLNQGVQNGQKYFSPQIVEQMYTNQLNFPGQSTGLGWEINTPLYMGQYASTHAFGKRGFTGCLMLTDPEKGLGFTLLANRTYPHRPLDGTAINAVRRDIADIIFMQ